MNDACAFESSRSKKADALKCEINLEIPKIMSPIKWLLYPPVTLVVVTAVNTQMKQLRLDLLMFDYSTIWTIQSTFIVVSIDVIKE